MDVPIDGSGGGLDGLLDPPTSSAFIAATSQDMILDDVAVGAELEHKPNNGPASNCEEEVAICVRCNMPGSDLLLLPCSCTLHAVSRQINCRGSNLSCRGNLSRRLVPSSRYSQLQGNFGGALASA